MSIFRPIPDDLDRAAVKTTIRADAAALPYPPFATQNNGDEQTHAPEYPLNFTKGLPHDEFGIVQPGAYEKWVAAINEDYRQDQAPSQDFTLVPTGESRIVGKNGGKTLAWRGWESPRSGQAYDLMGPDAGEVAMPPAPALGSDQLIAEMAEVYAMALLRDTAFTEIQKGTKTNIKAVITDLNKLPWFTGDGQIGTTELFRGSTAGSFVGPYLSQFLLQGPNGSGPTVPYGAQTINLESQQPTSGIDYMTTWAAWLDVQQGADVSNLAEPIKEPPRLIKTPRDLARYVQIDALYQAYQVATLTLLASDPRPPIQSGFPSGGRAEARGSFATFGDPHILSLVTEVATRALRAVRRQKYNHHRRGRPERIGAMLTLAAHGQGARLGAAQQGIELMLGEMKRIGLADKVDTFNQDAPLPGAVKKITGWAGKPGWWKSDAQNLLLPMAFIEGSPMHPAYGAGHATVAGACVTMMKCFFELVQGMQPGANMLTLADINIKSVEQDTMPPTPASELTVNGELDKIVANISIGRNMAGVHFSTDYTESIRMGERIAVGMVAEQLLTYGEPVSVIFETFDGARMRIQTSGNAFPREVSYNIVNSDGTSISFDQWWNAQVQFGLV